MLTLNVNAVRAFVMLADLQSFSRAAAALGTSHGTISAQLKRLEDRIGHQLIERAPRSVRLSAQGAAFLEGARDFITAHERAIAGLNGTPMRFDLGIAIHVTAPAVPTLLARLHAHDPNLTIEVQLDTSRKLLDLLDQGQLDVAIVHREDDRRDGETLAHERLGWFAAQKFEYRPGEPLRLATPRPTCRVRTIATLALDGAGIQWTEMFLGGGISAVHAAVSAGLAVAPLSYRTAPAATVDVGERFGLPPLPSSEVVVHSSLMDQRSRAALRVLAVAFREQLCGCPITRS